VERARELTCTEFPARIARGAVRALADQSVRNDVIEASLVLECAALERRVSQDGEFRGEVRSVRQRSSCVMA